MSEEEMKESDYQQLIEVTTCANRGYECQLCTRRYNCKYAEGL